MKNIPVRHRAAKALCAALLLGLAPPAAPSAEAPALRADVQCYSRTDTPGASALASQVSALAPLVVRWAEAQSADVLANGAPLAERFQRLAREAGVRRPGAIRLRVVDRIPLPDDAPVQAAATKVGVVQSSAAGLTLGYAILVVRGFEDDARLVSHELRHVAQYEACGGIPAFLGAHLGHLAEFGYHDSPFEVDARAHEAR